TQVLCYLHRQRLGVLAQRHIHVQRVVDVGHVVGRELDVDHRADDPGDQAGLAGAALAVAGGVLYGCGHDDAHSLPAIDSASALAPPTISLISCVISAWRALFASRVNCSSSSLALS